MADSSIIRLYGMAPDSIVDGPGLRYAVFVQGCSHGCPGCHNAESQPAKGGAECSVDDLVAKIRANGLVRNVTLSGGEPFEQAPAAAELAWRLKALDYGIWTYTGYLYEDLCGLCATAGNVSRETCSLTKEASATSAAKKDPYRSVSRETFGSEEEASKRSVSRETLSCGKGETNGLEGHASLDLEAGGAVAETVGNAVAETVGNAVAEVAGRAPLDRQHFSGRNPWRLRCSLLDPEAVRALLDATDVLVDGPFVESLRSLGLKWRGSSNQRLIDVPASRAAGHVVLWEAHQEFPHKPASW